MAKVVIFGVQDFASLGHFYLRKDSPHEVVAFSVHREYLPASATFEGLPVIPFDDLVATHPPADYALFAPMSHRKMNRLREQVYLEGKRSGYQFVSYISSRATVWMPELVGENCFILEDNTVQPYTKIGNNVVLWSGNHIGHHGTIGDHVLFTSHVVLSGHCTVGPYCFFGVNATIRDGLTIAEGSLIAMATSVSQNTEPWGVYRGNPAKKSEVPSHKLDS